MALDIVSVQDELKGPMGLSILIQELCPNTESMVKKCQVEPLNHYVILYWLILEACDEYFSLV